MCPAPDNYRSAEWILLAAYLLLVSGCANHPLFHPCDYEHLPPPVGTYAHAWQAQQSQQEQRSAYVLLKEDFLHGGASLSPIAREHLLQTLDRGLPLSRVIIETFDDEVVDSNRSDTVRSLLAQAHPDLAEHVCVEFVAEDSMDSDGVQRFSEATSGSDFRQRPIGPRSFY